MPAVLWPAYAAMPLQRYAPLDGCRRQSAMLSATPPQMICEGRIFAPRQLLLEEFMLTFVGREDVWLDAATPLMLLAAMPALFADMVDDYIWLMPFIA